MIKCSHCGASLPDGEVVCPMCGCEVQLVPDYEKLDLNMMVVQNDMGEREVQRLEEQRSKRKKQIIGFTILKILLIAGIIAIAVAGVAVAVNKIKATMNTSTEKSFDDVYAEALAAYEKGEYQDAYNIICTALEMNSSSSEAIVLKGKISYKLGNPDEAKQILLTLVADDPYCEEAYMALIEIYQEEKQYTLIYDLITNANEDMKKIFWEYYAMLPLFSIEGGVYNTEIDVAITCAEGNTLYVTTDGSEPTEQSPLYAGPIHLGEGVTVIKAIVVTPKGVLSPVTTNEYNINFEAPDPPVIETPSGTYSGTDNLIKVTVPAGCTAYYAIDSRPVIGGQVYTEPVAMPEGRHFFYCFLVNEKGVDGMMAMAYYQYSAVAPVVQAIEEYVYPTYRDYYGDDYYYDDTDYSGGGDEPYYPTPTTTPEPTPTQPPEPEPTPTQPSEPEPTTTPEPTPTTTPEPTPTTAPESATAQESAPSPADVEAGS